jgi:hypothetical protein
MASSVAAIAAALRNCQMRTAGLSALEIHDTGAPMPISTLRAHQAHGAGNRPPWERKGKTF